jgi:hypothetical protein
MRAALIVGLCTVVSMDILAAVFVDGWLRAMYVLLAATNASYLWAVFHGRRPRRDLLCRFFGHRARAMQAASRSRVHHWTVCRRCDRVLDTPSSGARLNRRMRRALKI